jgi:CRISPR-associated protein Csm5
MAEYRYRWIITTLTPLHIGSGERLREGFDFIQKDGSLWIADQGALFRVALEEALRVRRGDEAQIAAEIAGMNLYQILNNRWLRPEHFDLSRGVFAYRLAGSTSKKQQEGELHAHIKDGEYRPYLPGSSLKGALRSAVLRAAAARKEEPRPEYRQGNPKTAASPMERRYFAAPRIGEGEFPNYDLWRALRITDSTPLPKEMLTLAQAVVYIRPLPNQREKKAETIPLDLEVIPAGVTLEAGSWVDTWLFADPRAATALGFSRRQQAWVTTGLVKLVREETRARLREEHDFYYAIQQQGGALPQGIGRAIANLIDAFSRLEANEFILPVGKGTGWRSKTLGRVLQEKLTDPEFDRLVREFKLGRGRWQRNEAIPYTRLLANVDNAYYTPLGWIKIRLEPEP